MFTVILCNKCIEFPTGYLCIAGIERPCPNIPFIFFVILPEFTTKTSTRAVKAIYIELNFFNKVWLWITTITSWKLKPLISFEFASIFCCPEICCPSSRVVLVLKPCNEVISHNRILSQCEASKESYSIRYVWWIYCRITGKFFVECI